MTGQGGGHSDGRGSPNSLFGNELFRVIPSGVDGQLRATAVHRGESPLPTLPASSLMDSPSSPRSRRSAARLTRSPGGPDQPFVRARGFGGRAKRSAFDASGVPVSGWIATCGCPHTPRCRGHCDPFSRASERELESGRHQAFGLRHLLNSWNEVSG
jgi:hypothetical protein